ncbi:hypothetical protein RN001_009381 [Aquatica leii]|uniref:Uncharacterized protein n=1 Tax=Aquatica leii TaxID=1421715 RepID=A0AAN7Q2G0_9COLE|nr:hypothetical protein RN001_009381 [Aquatica leii]
MLTSDLYALHRTHHTFCKMLQMQKRSGEQQTGYLYGMKLWYTTSVHCVKHTNMRMNYINITDAIAVFAFLNYHLLLVQISLSLSSLPHCFSRHKRYCGPKKICSTEECDEAKKVFGNFLKTAKLPSFEEIQNVRIHNDVLQEISPQAIRMWIENQLLKKRKMSSCDRPSVVKQIRWSDVEKKSLCEAFSKHIHGTSLPSQSEILFSIEKFPELKNRSVKCIKTAIVNEKNRYKTG